MNMLGWWNKHLLALMQTKHQEGNKFNNITIGGGGVGVLADPENVIVLITH